MSDPLEAGQHVPSGSVSPGAIVAVLPFVDVSDCPVINGYCLRVTKAVVRALGHGGLSTRIETAPAPSQRFDVHLLELARRLGGTALLLGSLREAQGFVALRLELIRAEDGRSLWTAQHDCQRFGPRGALERFAAEIAGEIQEQCALMGDFRRAAG